MTSSTRIILAALHIIPVTLAMAIAMAQSLAMAFVIILQTI